MKGGDTPLRRKLASMLSDAGLDPQAKVFAQLDANGDGNIGIHEFLAAFSEELALFKLFDVLDADGSGALDRAELQQLAKRPRFVELFERMPGQAWCRAGAPSLGDFFLGHADGDGDGHVDFDEFRVQMVGYKAALAAAVVEP
jgi:Ca2+-binding EF-hand superfamily protein